MSTTVIAVASTIQYSARCVRLNQDLAHPNEYDDVSNMCNSFGSCVLPSGLRELFQSQMEQSHGDV